MESRSQTTIERPPLNSPAQILDDFIFQAATTYASMNQSPASTDIKDQQHYEWHHFFFRVFQDKLWYYKYFLSYGAKNAQNLIDAIQTLLHVDWVNVQFKSILEIALLRFAQTYQLFPPSLLLNDLLHRNALPAYNDMAVRGTHNGRAVSVKISASRSESSAFRQSILIWTRLRHENVLPVYGMCMIARYDDLGRYDGVGLVSPFMNKGNVINFLKKNQVAYRQSFILDVARGMSYLHDSGVVHGRIHMQNILITSTDPPRACLTDFGRAPVLPIGTRAKPFLAPELDVPGPQYPPRTRPSDVYAFSTASYEILTSSKINWIAGSNPSMPDDGGIDELTWQILLDSWQRDPDQRPTADRIVERLEEIIQPRKRRIERLKSGLNDILNVKEDYKQFLYDAEANAQKVLDIFQLLLDTSQVRLEDRNQLIVAMRRLSGRTELYPSRFILNCPLPITEPIAFGGFADVHKVRVDHLDHDVCVKVIRVTVSSLSSQEHMAKVYAREVINWGQLSHQNILPFYGLWKYGLRLCLVSPWANNGNLVVYLEKNPKASRVLLCLDTAAGVEYLHKIDIVHGDLKGLNILIDNSGRACLGDFGLSSVTDPQILRWTSQSTESISGGTTRWRAPEILNPENDDEGVHNSKESDVFSWASTCYEIFTGLPPFYEINSNLHVMRAITDGKRPTRPQGGDPAWSQHHLNDDIWKLMEDCWSFVPSERPSMTNIIPRLGAHKPIDSRPPGDWEEGASMRFRMAYSHDEEIPKDLSSLWDRLGDLLPRIVPGAFDQ